LKSGTALLGAVAALWIALLVGPHFIPLVDLPQHVATASLLAGAIRPEIAARYETQLFPQVNVLALFCLTPLQAAFGEAAGVRLFLALYVVALALALRHLSRVAAGSIAGAIAAMCFAIDFNMMYGFVSWCLGVPILLLLLARYAGPQRPGPRTWSIDAVLWLLLLLAHALLAAFAAAAGVLWVLRSPRGAAAIRSRTRRLSALAPAALYGLAWLLKERATMARLQPANAGRHDLEALWHGPAAKLSELGRTTLVFTADGRFEWLAIALLAGIAASLWILARRQPAAPAATGSLRATDWLRGVALLAVVAWALLPWSIYRADVPTYGLFLLYPRFLVLAPLVFLPTLRWPARPRARTGFAVALGTVHLLLASQRLALFTRIDRDAVGLDGAIAAIAPAGVVKCLIYTPVPDGARFESFLHVASYYQARRRGETDQSFALLPTHPVHYRDLDRPYLSRHDEHLRPQDFDPTTLRTWDALLVYDRDGSHRTPLPNGTTQLAYSQNGWQVFEVVK
jgi:hypothetical protein